LELQIYGKIGRFKSVAFAVILASAVCKKNARQGVCRTFLFIFFQTFVTTSLAEFSVLIYYIKRSLLTSVPNFGRSI